MKLLPDERTADFSAGNLWPLALVMAMSSVLCMLLLKRLEKE